ncbi:tRNA-specific adenosine deaminase subunit tad3 [Yamadazyma tenuis]|nr:tRNA-specific adenosine deaminase subunit tad3 [Yamadazyma tenuis]
MAKIKDVDHPHIDFEKAVIYGKLKQIKYSKINNVDANIPRLTSVWCCRLKPQQTKAFVKFIRECITPYEPQTFTHIKRLKKIGTGKDFRLDGILCSSSLFTTKDQILELIHEYSDPEISEMTSDQINEVKIPSNIPTTREISLEWSEKFWPMSWRGDPNAQFLKEVKFDIVKEKQMIRKLLDVLETATEEIESKKPTLPVATIVVNPNNEEIVSTSFDCRLAHPLHHSVMLAIEQVAQNEKKSRLQKSAHSVEFDSGYLLNGLVVYTTHEPCVMCSMGLVHSRIKRVIYLQPMKSGGLETNYQLGDRDDLNWNFETWRWLEEEDLKKLHEIERKYKTFDQEVNV